MADKSHRGFGAMDQDKQRQIALAARLKVDF